MVRRKESPVAYIMATSLERIISISSRRQRLMYSLIDELEMQEKGSNHSGHPII